MTRLFITAALCLMLYGCGSSTPSVPAPPPPVQPPTTPVAPGPDLYRRKEPLRYGYYGAEGDQVPQTREHVNLHWELFWGGEDDGIERMREAAMDTVIDVAGCLFDGGQWNEGPRASAEQDLRGLLNRLSAAGVLRYVKGIVPIDEPNLPAHWAVDSMPAACGLIRAVAADYPELAGVRLMAIYFTERPMAHMDLFDVVGFDNYKQGARVLQAGGLADKILSQLLPHQRLILVPGGSYAQDPSPFIEYALGNPRVFAVVPFLWVSKTDGHAIAGIGERPLMRPVYEQAGRQVLALGDRVWQIKRPSRPEGNFA